MSFVSFKRDAQLSASVQPTVEQNDLATVSMRIDVVPVPSRLLDTNMEKTKVQNASIVQIRDKGQDLFHSNQTLMSNNGGKRLYQTEDLYGKILAVEDLIPMLTSADLTLRLNALRSGTHSHATCMELKTGVLADALDESVGAKGEKVVSVSIDTAPEKGKMFVGLKYAKGKHYISKVDYEVDSIVDDSLHLK